MNPYTLLPFSAFVLNLGLLLFIYGRGIKTKLQKVLACVLVCVANWTFFDFLIWNSVEYSRGLVLFFYDFQMLGYMFLGPCLCYFVYEMLKLRKDFYYKILFIPPTVACLIGWTTGLVTNGYHATEWGMIHEPGPLFIYLTLLCSGLPAEIAIIRTFLSLKNCKNNAEKIQRHLVIWGSAVVLHVGILTNLLLPHVFGYEDFVQLGSCFCTIFALCLFWAVYKFDLIPITLEAVIKELFDSNRQGVAVVNELGTVVQMNHSAEKLLNVKSSESLKIEDVLPAEKVNSEKMKFPLEYTDSKDNTVYLQISRDRHMSQGVANGWIYLITDFTKERIAENEIKELNNSLEVRVKERTIELESSHAELLAQKKELEELGKYKSEFLANLSHEIRTPMNAVLGFTDLMLHRDKLDYESESYLKNIKNSSLNLLDLLNDLLDFSKIEQRKVEYEKIPTNLESVFMEACDIAKVKVGLHKKNLYVLTDTNDLKFEVLTDPIRIKQVILNLLTNAIKFTDKGTIRSGVRLLKESDQEISLQFYVKDTGIGIPEEKREHIFKAFTQVDGTTTRQYGGTGLGLSICTQIIENMGGKISLESEVGKGSEFTFVLTFAKGEKLKGLPDSDKISVAVLEPDESCNQLILSSLGCMNCEINACEDLDQALLLGDKIDWLLISSEFEDSISLISQKFKDSNAKLLVLYPQIPKVPLGEAEEGLVYRLAYPVSAFSLSSLFHFSIQGKHRKHYYNIPKMRILMAEDNMFNQRFQRALLEKHQHTIVIVENGLEALEALESEDFDLILMDIHMPHMNGIETVKEIRKNENNTPVIGMTANIDDKVRQECLDAGMNWFVNKPLDSTEFDQVMSRVRAIPNELNIS